MASIITETDVFHSHWIAMLFNQYRSFMGSAI